MSCCLARVRVHQQCTFRNNVTATRTVYSVSSIDGQVMFVFHPTSALVSMPENSFFVFCKRLGYDGAALATSEVGLDVAHECLPACSALTTARSVQ